MSMRYKCTVIDIYDEPEMSVGPIYGGTCQNEGTVEVDTEDIEAANEKLRAEAIVGNYICEMHAERVGDI